MDKKDADIDDKFKRHEMEESMIGSTITACIQNLIYDFSSGACKGIIKRYKRRKFCKSVEKKIQSFCLRNESLYIDSESFKNFIVYHKPFYKVMENALSIDDSISIYQLSDTLIAEAEESAKISNQVLSEYDRRALKDLLILINNEITMFFESVLDDSQKYIVSKNIQNTKMLQKDIKALGDGNNQKIESLEKVLREAISLSDNEAESIAELICKKMWLGDFDDIETISVLASAKSADLEIVICIIKKEILENKHEIDDIKRSISKIDNKNIRTILIRNLIPLLFFRKEKFDGIGSFTDSEYLKTIMNALDNEDYSYLFSMETSVEKGVEMRKYTLNKNVMDVEPWLVNQVFAIYIYNIEDVNTASLLETTIDPKTSWFSALITYDRKVDQLSCRELNDQAKKELSELEELLKNKKNIYDYLSDDLVAVYYALIMKIFIIFDKSGDDIIKSVPTKLHGLRPVKDYLLEARIKSKKISFEELYDFCNEEKEYWLLSNYFLTLRDDKEDIVNRIKAHEDLLTKSETIFIIYVESLVRIGRIEEAKANLLKYKSAYDRFFEFWNSFLDIDHSVKDEFIRLCKENRIVYITGHSGCVLVERLIKFEEYELADFYNSQLKIQQINRELSRKFEAFILNGKNKQIDALECFKLAFIDFPNDPSIINAILTISIQLKRRIETEYIRAAEESNNLSLLVRAGGAYAINGDFSSAHRCNLKALFMSDECDNPAFNQYLDLRLQDKQEEISNITSVEKNVAVLLQSSNNAITYCVHGDIELPESPCIWHGDTHIYINDAAKIGIFGKHIGNEVIINGISYTIKQIESLDTYIFRICFESLVKNGSAKAITTTAKDGQIDVEEFVNQMREHMPDSSKEVNVIQRYNNFEEIAFPFYMISKRSNVTYTQFVELMIEEPKSCIREVDNNNFPSNDKFVLSFASVIILKILGISSEKLADYNTFVTESTVLQISEDTAEMIAHYANDSVSSMFFYEGQPYLIDTDESVKEKWIKEAGELKAFVEGIPSVVCKKDWKTSTFDQIKMTETLGVPDYDAISIGVNDGYTVIGTEAMITSLAMHNEINANVVSITNWLISNKMDVLNLIHLVNKMVAMGCIYSLTEEMVMYVSNNVETLIGEERNEILVAWDSLFITYDLVDVTYRVYGVEALRRVYISARDRIDEPSKNQVLMLFARRLLWLINSRITDRPNEKG